jgi:hypothetical protein
MKAFWNYVICAVCAVGTYSAWGSVGETTGWLKFAVIIAGFINPALAVFNLVDGVKEQVNKK